MAGATDTETEWDLPSPSINWGAGFSSSGTEAYYDYGDAGGCSTTSTAPPPGRPCNNGWYQGDVWNVSWHVPGAYPLPEQYNTTGAQADQWEQLSLYGYQYEGGAMFIEGSFTQYEACLQNGNCSGTDNTPGAGWTQLYNALNSNPNTMDSLPWSTDVEWDS